MRIYRLSPKSGRKQYHLTQDGYSLLANPKHGNERHHAMNKVLVRTEQEMADLIKLRYSVNVGIDTAPSMVRPSKRHCI